MSQTETAAETDGAKDTEVTEAEKPTLTEIRERDAAEPEKTADTAEGDADADKAGAGDEAGGEGAEGEESDEKGAVPEKPEDYDFSLPEDIGLKDEKGDPFQFDKDDPLLGELGALAHENGITQEAMSKLLGLYGRAVKESVDVGRAATEEQYAAAAQEELGKLETKDSQGKTITGVERVQSVYRRLDAALGDGASSSFEKSFTNADIVLGVEKLLTKLDDQAGAPKAGGSGTEGLRGAKRLRALRENGS